MPRYFLPLVLAPLVVGLSACDVNDPGTVNGPAFTTGGVSYDDPRSYHPVVLSDAAGQFLNPLLGYGVGDIVAFAYDAAEGAFVQIPVQIDERYVYDIADLYQGVNCNDGWCQNVAGHIVEAGYADANSAAGPDPNPAFDADDEAVLLLSDFGDEAQGHPDGVRRTKGVEVQVTFDGADHYAYLYPRGGNSNLDPAAGRDYVTYNFDPVNAFYDIEGEDPGDFTGQLTPSYHGVSNPEQTWVEAEGYRLGFADRWIMDYLAVGPADNRSPDLLTVDMLRFTDNPNSSGLDGCVRWDFTGSAAEGGFLVNRDGPIRGIRRAIGFNSGPLTEMTWTFYPHSFEMVSTLRVHKSTHGIATFFHLSPAAQNYTYGYGSGGPGTPITDVIDGADAGFGSVELPAWQIVHAPETTWPSEGKGWAMTYDLDTDIPFNASDEQPRLFYSDDGTSDGNCDIDNVSGNNFANARTSYRGAHGIEVPFQSAWGNSNLPNGGLPNTDPRQVDGSTSLYHLSLTRSFAFSPDPSAALASVLEPETVTSRRYR